MYTRMGKGRLKRERAVRPSLCRVAEDTFSNEQMASRIATTTKTEILYYFSLIRAKKKYN